MRTSRNTRKTGKRRPDRDTKKRMKSKSTAKTVLRRYMQEKLAIVALAIMLALFALILVLYNIVNKNGDEYTQIVLSHQDYKSTTLPYKRGNIVDRNGTILATSEKVYNVVLAPKLITNGEDNYEYHDATVDALVETFGYNRSEVLEAISSHSSGNYYVYEKQVSADRKDAFEDYMREKNAEFRKLPVNEGGRQRVAGVTFEENYRRFYPYNELACNIIGFALRDDNPSGGVEQYYNSQLTGINGREYGYLNGDANLERVVKSPVNGNTLELTIDTNIQKICEKYINEWQAGIGSDVAAVIVMDPNTAEILAMDTSTRFNLNDPYNLDAYFTPEQQATMTDEEKSDAWYRIWRNFCVNDTFEPGSPQKAFTVAGAMEEGVISGYEVIECGGKMHVGDWDIRCVARLGHGPLTITQGLMKSCNVVMMHIVQAEGKENFVKNQRNFGFGSKTGVDLPGEADTSRLVYSASNMDAASLATNSFGQNYNCTMIQMAAAYCSLINGGSYYQPHVVKEILNDQGAVVKKNGPYLVRETVSENTSKFIQNALFETVSGVGGTAGAAAVAGYEVGGKTGTAQKLPRWAKNYLVSFIGFAPAYDPQVLVYVVIDTPHLIGEEQAHSTFASETFSKIMGEILPYTNVFPEGAVTADLSTDLSELAEGITVTEPQNPEAPQFPAVNPETGLPWVSYDEEFIDSAGEGYDYPDTMPWVDETDEAQESAAAPPETGNETPDGEAAPAEAGEGTAA